MELPVIKIGNSSGIRFSKTIIEKYKIKDTVELDRENDCIIIRPKSTPRNGWEEAFKAMHENNDDQLLIADIFENENFEETN